MWSPRSGSCVGHLVLEPDWARTLRRNSPPLTSPHLPSCLEVRTSSLKVRTSSGPVLIHMTQMKSQTWSRAQRLLDSLLTCPGVTSRAGPPVKWAELRPQPFQVKHWRGWWRPLQEALCGFRSKSRVAAAGLGPSDLTLLRCRQLAEELKQVARRAIGLHQQVSSWSS